MRKETTVDCMKKELMKDVLMGTFKWKIVKVKRHTSIPRTHYLQAKARMLHTDEIIAMANFIEEFPCGMNIVNNGGKIYLQVFR